MECFNLKSAIESKNICHPVVFRNFSPVQLWSFCSMTPEKMANVLQDVKIKFRIGKQELQSDVQWEGNCHYIDATMKEFCDWTKGEKSCSAFDSIDKHCCWAYADYIYMRDLFKLIPDFHVSEHVDWSKLGFGKEDGLDMAIWIGTKGAHTVCHYDTYGYNLVVQISGRKRWTLFPPDDSATMYPTRIPYEESTVFSKVNLLNPDLTKHSRFAFSHPHVVVLEPGDVLFVPTHWWHFVENLELSISINAWFPCDSDPQQRVSEAITRLLIGASVSYEESDQKTFSAETVSHWINPTESLSTAEENVALLQNALLDFHNKGKHEEEIEQPSPKNAHGCDCVHGAKSCLPNVDCHAVDRYCFKHACKVIENWNELSPVDTSTVNDKPLKRPRLSEKANKSEDLLTLRHVVECFTRPSVVESIRTELQKDRLL